jgi:hypothetical protein
VQTHRSDAMPKLRRSRLVSVTDRQWSMRPCSRKSQGHCCHWGGTAGRRLEPVVRVAAPRRPVDQGPQHARVCANLHLYKPSLAFRHRQSR